jgi:hypothetical protein
MPHIRLLNELPRGTKLMVRANGSPDLEPGIFHRLDGMYSVCTLSSRPADEKLFHLYNMQKLIEVGDHWELVDLAAIRATAIGDQPMRRRGDQMAATVEVVRSAENLQTAYGADAPGLAEDLMQEARRPGGGGEDAWRFWQRVTQYLELSAAESPLT